ncbi:FecR family protein [Pedobacter faecalis]|uniref:FecR family protein n=1 Tax=Pedobacter faecalis TaxID=3041495 RepID=UPI002549CFBC|nr:FecR domain-containing protein [Pedobacter sp. ELA7]
MSGNTDNIEQLVSKFERGTISESELQVLTNWYNSHDDESVIIPLKKQESREQIKSRVLTGLLYKIDPDRVRPRYQTLRWLAGVAAAIIVALGFWVVAEKEIFEHVQTKHAKMAIKPGGNRASLTLADGKTIELSTRQSGIVAGQQITYTDGEPITSFDGTANDGEVQYFTLHTPRGGTYKITLPDGTEVWLNAASKLKYPSRFATGGRLVELEGEAYFHVRPAYEGGKKIPFHVAAGKHQVEVLGTQFNINAYPEERTVKTTLIEGKVSVSDQQQRFVLRPDEQAVTGPDGTTIKQVNAGSYAAWRDGKFVFDGKTFEESFAEIERWYDLEVVYTDQVPEAELVGDAYRNQNIGLVLRVLKSAEIDYQLDVKRRQVLIKGMKKK